MTPTLLAPASTPTPPYSPPRLTRLGTLGALTLGPHHGTHPDGFGFAIRLSA